MLLGTNGNSSGTIKNLFTTGGARVAGTHHSIYNDPANGQIYYPTFYDSRQYGNFASDVQNASVGNVFVQGNLTYQGPNSGIPNGCAADGFPDTGLQRPALAVGGPVGLMRPAAPNPVADETTIGYALPYGTQRAELLVQAGLTGKEVLRRPLPVGMSEDKLTVRELPDGLYFCTLLADGVPVQTQRLLVAH